MPLQRVAMRHGLILVDTKYEFGKAPDGTVVLIDEVSCALSLSDMQNILLNNFVGLLCFFKIYFINIGAYTRLK